MMRFFVELAGGGAPHWFATLPEAVRFAERMRRIGFDAVVAEHRPELHAQAGQAVQKKSS